MNNLVNPAVSFVEMHFQSRGEEKASSDLRTPKAHAHRE
jgi:hypothetical protein